MSLFVSVSDDEEYVTPDSHISSSGSPTPSLEIKQEKIDDDDNKGYEDIEIDDDDLNNNTNIKSGDEEDDDDDDEDDDEILFEIPINFTSTNSQSSLKTIVVQNPTTRQSASTNTTIKTRLNSLRLKPVSKTMEITSSLSTLKFFNQEKSEHWNKIQDLTMKGNLVDSNEKNYLLCKLTSTSEGSQVIESCKIDYVSQIRPNFKYLDDYKTLKNQTLREQQQQLLQNDETSDPNSNGNNGKVHVVQMSAKSSGENQPRLSGALVARKLEDEEEFIVFENGNDNDNVDDNENAMDVDDNDDGTEGKATTTTASSSSSSKDNVSSIVKVLFGDDGSKTVGEELVSNMQMDEYLESLVKDTKVIIS